MGVYTLNPLEDRRWPDLVRRHPRASVFHSPAWLGALRRTYGYEFVAWTTSPPTAELANALLVCRIPSWLTARRMVGLPFTDHCDPLVERPDEQEALFGALQRTVADGPWKFGELRLRHPVAGCGARVSRSYCFHVLDLRPSLPDLFQALHKDCIQRRIRHAEREGLSVEQGRSSDLVAGFYRLLIMTRRRHRLPPQPLSWFKNLATCMGDGLTVHLASKDRHPVGGVITLTHRDSLVYKYGASDARFHKWGTMPLLFWSVIQHAKRAGMRELDLGRSDADDAGLITFKDRLGAARSTVTHLRYGTSDDRLTEHVGLARTAGELLSHAPDKVFVAAGRILYRHIG